MKFDYHKFLTEKWGSPDKLLRFLRSYDVNLQYPTVNMWFRRRSIPAEHFATLLALMKLETGIDVKLEDYLL